MKQRKTFVIIATGSPVYGNMAINLCLSIKANSSIPVLLIHDKAAFNGLTDLLYIFDNTKLIRGDSNPMSLACHTKLKLYNMLMKDYSECILLDADTLILPNKDINSWFNQQEPFKAQTNYHFFDYKTETHINKPSTAYHFWCDPIEAKKYFNIPDNAIMPQINASFIYFRKDNRTKKIFDTALQVWKDKNFQTINFRGSKTEEVCFNISLAKHSFFVVEMYVPIFFFYYKNFTKSGYLKKNTTALGLAGDNVPDNIINIYNYVSGNFRFNAKIKNSFILKPNTKKKAEVKQNSPSHV